MGEHERGSGTPVLVVTAMPLSKVARAELSEMLGPGYTVVDIQSAPSTANIVLTPVVSGMALSILRGTFPQARILFTELHDDDRGISFVGPLSRIVALEPDGYFVAHSLDALGPIVQTEAQLQLSGTSTRTPLALSLTPNSPAGPTPSSQQKPEAQQVTAAQQVRDVEQPPNAKQPPNAHQMRDAQQTPTEQQTPDLQRTPYVQQALTVQQVPGEQETRAGAQMPQAQEVPDTEQVPVVQQVPAAGVVGAAGPASVQGTGGVGAVVWWVDCAVAASVPAGRWLDLDAVDALVVRLVGTDEPRRDGLWPAVVAECVVRLAGSGDADVLVDVGGLEPAVRAELQIRVESEQVDQARWP